MTNDSGINGWLTELSDIGSFVAELGPIIFWVAVFASWLVLAIFRRRVRHSLEGKQSPTETQDSTSTVAPPAPETGAEHERSTAPEAIPSDSQWHTLSADASSHRARLAKLHIFGGLGLAIAFAAIHTIATADQSQPPFLRVLYSAICFSTPLILIARLVYGRWTPRLVRIAIPAAVLIGLSQALPIANEQTAAAIIFTALFALLLHPWIRAMGPLALGFFTVVFLGTSIAIVTALFLLQGEMRADPQTTVIRESIQNMDPAQQFEALIAFSQDVMPIILQRVAVGAAVGLPVSLLLGALLLVLVTTSYARKRTSDQWLVVASVWLFFAVIVAPRDSPVGLVANLACATAFVFVVRSVGSRLLRSEGPCLRLLLLRSFSLGERGNRLFQKFETLWRGVGSAQLVGAADLAVSTLEPHELLDFIRGRSGRYFAHSETDVDCRLASFDYARDPDGRFRINEVFCSGDATWQHAVRRLLAETDCVLMDARGFTRYRAGCVFEIGCLAQSAARPRIVFLVDDVTDRNFIAEIWTNATGGPAASAHKVALEFVPEHQGGDGVCERIIAAFSRPRAPSTRDESHD